MKPMSLNYGISSAALLAGCLLMPAGVQAGQLAYEGFDYPTGASNLSGLTGGGSGWNGTWVTINNGSADVVTGSLAAGANAPANYDLRLIGNSSNLPNQRRIGRRLDTSASGPFGTAGFRDGSGRIGATGKTIYLSFTQQPNGTSAYYEFEFHRGDLGDPGRIGGIGNDQGGDNVHLRAPNDTHTFIGTGNTAVNFYVVRIDFKDGNDDVFVYRNPTSLTEPGVPTLTRLAAADMSFDGISFGAFNNGRTVAHDEVRLGESWADVTIPPAAQPVITSQPRPSTSFTGGTVVLSAAASGQPLPAYQWFKGNDPISGQTGATLTLTNVQSSDAATYHVTATNTQGTVPSDPAQVTVLATPPGLLAYEGFDYNAGSGNLAGQGGGLGWGAAWAAVNGGGGNVLAGNLPAGTNAPNGYDAQSLGNSSFMPNAQRDGRLVDTSPGGRFGAAGYVDGSGNIGMDGKTLYLSFLQQPDGTSKFYEFEFHRGNLGDPGRIGGIGNDTMNPTTGLRTGGTTTVIGPGSTGVNLYVVRIDYKPGPDDVYVYQNPISATEPGVATLTKLAASDMSFNGLSLAAFDNGRTVKHDEIRLGQSWSDVIFGTSRRELVWAGDGSTNNWDFVTQNWTVGATATTFADGDPVTFDDSGSDTPAVNIPASVSTASLIVDNSAKNYVFGGEGTINSSGGLLKSGSGSLSLNGPATFNSAIVVEGGSLALNGTTSAGGGLNANEGSTTLGGTNSLGGLVSENGSVTITGPTTITSGAFAWIGNLEGTDSTLTIETGGSLSMLGTLGDSFVIGRDGGKGVLTQNGGTVTYNPTNRPEIFIGASLSTATTAAYNMNGGTLEMSSKRLTLALGPITSHLNQSGGAIHLNHLLLGATLPTGPGTGIYNLTGGSISIGNGGITSVSGQYEVNLGGGSIAATANWSSPLNITLTNGDVTLDTASQTVTLSGSIGGGGGLVKTGSGTLLLTGLNSYTGSTMVSAGTLAGFGGSDQSALTVASGASVSPGDNSVSTFYAGSATFASGSTLAIEVDSSSTFADQLVSFGAANINGVNLTLEEAVGGTLPLNTSLVLIDAATGLTGTFAGYPEGSTISAGANTFSIHYSANQVTLTTVAGSVYSTWANSKGLDATPGKDPAFDADPENDGVSNGLEWILGGDPLAADGGALVTATGSATNGLTLTFTREEASLGNASLIVQWDADLMGTWTDVPISQAGGSHANGVTVAVNQTATPDAVTVHIPASNAPNGRLFGRLMATMP